MTYIHVYSLFSWIWDQNNGIELQWLCIDALCPPSNTRPQSLIAIKNHGGLITPPSIITVICQIAESKLRFLLQTERLQRDTLLKFAWKALDRHLSFGCLVHCLDVFKMIAIIYSKIRLKYETEGTGHQRYCEISLLLDIVSTSLLSLVMSRAMYTYVVSSLTVFHMCTSHLFTTVSWVLLLVSQLFTEHNVHLSQRWECKW